jgi:protocatechuate 3,4-dioxygenase beta subunit
MSIKSNRRKFIKVGIIGVVTSFFVQLVHAKKPTPEEIKGPFYPIVAQQDKDFDLTKMKGSKGVAKGTIVIIQGKILDTKNNPIENATIDLWQANAAGKYRHPHDNSKAPLDPNFQGWAIILSKKDGSFRFKTIIPGAYPASNTWIRPPHIHFKISKVGYIEIITQMYFPDQSLNDSDLLLQRKSQAKQALMIASKAAGEKNIFEYNIVLQKA